MESPRAAAAAVDGWNAKEAAPASKDNTSWARNCPAGTVSKADPDPDVLEQSESWSSDSVELPSPIRKNLRGKAFERHSDRNLAKSTVAAD